LEKEKHYAYSKHFDILFFNEESPFNNFKILGPEKNIWGVLCTALLSSNARCGSESMRGAMNCLEKGNLAFSKRGGSR
jgi:plasmid rolling circle replication initiator protein Rep